MSNGTTIAAEVRAALIEAGEAVGNGPLVCTIKRVWGGADTPFDEGFDTVDLFEVIAKDDETRLSDVTGTLIGRTIRTLTVDATGVVPLKSDRIAVGYAKLDRIPGDAWLQINDVIHVAPGGVDLMFRLEIAR